MPILSNTNRSPYFDDYDPNKNFYRVEFKPGYPVQARELTQLQTIVNDQFEQLAGKFFKNGDTIIPGDCSIGNPVSYVRLSSITQGSRAVDYIGYTLTGVVSGVKAVVNYAEERTDNDDVTFFVNYISSGDSTEESTFTEGETLESDHPDNFTANVGVTGTSKPVTSKPMGHGSLVTVNEGSYYVNGFMVRNREQTISLDKYSTKPTTQVGFTVDENFVTSNEDPSLLDNSQGHSNFAAPGADRLQINLILSKRDEDTELPNFIPLLNLLQGNIIGSPSQNVKWDWLYDLLAKRTYDESGDYIITEFPIKPLEYWNSEIIDGVFDAEPDRYGDDTPYPPVPQSGETQPLTFEDADGNYAISVSPGEAYVQGYNVGYLNPFYVYGNKPRQHEFIDDTYTQINPGIFIKVSNIYGTPDFENIEEEVSTSAFDSIVSYRNFTDGHVGAAFSGDNLDGDTNSRSLNIGNKPWVTYHIITDTNIGDLQEEAFEDGVTTVNIDGVNAIVVYPTRIVNSAGSTPGKIKTESNLFIITESGDNLVKDFIENSTSKVDAKNSIVVHIPSDHRPIRGSEIGSGGSRAVIVSKIEPSMSGVVDPKYFYPDLLVTNNSLDPSLQNSTSEPAYRDNSTFNLGVLSSEYFTEFVVIEDSKYPVQFWKDSIGKLIFGQQSRSSAKIEDYVKNKLTVSNINGQFVEGEYLDIKSNDWDQLEGDSFVLDESGFNLLQENKGKLILDLGSFTSTTARILRTGEIVDLHFNSYIGSDQQGNPGGGGDGSDGGSGSAGGIIINVFPPGSNDPVYTSDVRLSNPTTRGISLPDEFGFTTQEGANTWFYEAIKSIVFGDEANNIFLSKNPPTDPSREDLWVNENDYVTYIWEGNYWVGLTPDESNSIMPNASPAERKGLGDLRSRLFPSSVASNYGEEGFSETSTFVDERDPFTLKNEVALTFVGVGSSLTLFKNIISPDGGTSNDFFYDEELNTLNLTESGRSKIHNYAFFNPEQTLTPPRINYEVISYPNNIRGYGVTSPSRITNTLKKTKSFWSDLKDDNDFSSDVALERSQGGDVISIANGSSFTGSEGRNFIVCDSFDGDASRDLIAGDVLAITNDNGYIEYKLVTFATASYGYAKNKTKSTVYFTTTLERSVSSKQIQRLRLGSLGDSTESLIYQLPVSVVHSLETDPNVTDVEYQVFRQFVGELEKGQTEITFSTTNSNEYFISDPLKVTIAVSEVVLGSTQEIQKLEGRILQLSQILPIKLSDGGRKVSYLLNAPLPNDVIIKAICPIKVKNAKAKRKNLITDTTIEIDYDTSNIYDPITSPASQRIVALNYADVYRINSIMEGDKDITDNYVFDDGQRDTFYDISRVVRKSGRSIPTGPLKINFDYFEHVTSTSGDFFSVDSYLHDRGVDYKDIPVYRPTAVGPQNSMTAENKNLSIKLRDCVDFRPIVNTIGDNASYDPILSDKLTQYATNFDSIKVNGNAHVPRIPIPSTQFKSDIDFYLPKIDSLFLDKSGRMVLREGEPSKRPVSPPDISTGIRLYDLYMPAYTFNIDDIVIRKFNHRRYTMKDIMDIDKRVNRVEKLVSLSLLEQSALNMSVRDSVTGLDRFKNGIVVDTFKDHSKGDVGNDQYRCSVDPKESHLRPSYVVDQIRLEEKYQTDEEVDKFGSYRRNNGVITCDYTDVDFIKQTVATRSTKLQTYTTDIFEGNIIMDPAMDTFYDTQTLPKLVISNNNLYDAMLNLTKDQVSASMGTVWTDWETDGRTPQDRVNQLGRESTNTPVANQKISDFFTTGSVRIASSSSAAQQARNDFHLSRDVSTSMMQSTSYGDRMVDIQLSKTMRSIPVSVKAERLKPNTRYFAFFDDIEVSDWFCVDNIEDDYSDGRKRYAGSPNDNPKGFGESIISDEEGNITGVFVIPNGRPPVKGSKFTGRMEDVQYQTSGNTRSFSTGQRTFKLVSNRSTSANLTELDGYAAADFVSQPVIMDKKDTVVSTRLASHTTNVTMKEDVRLNYDGDSSDYDPSGIPSLVPTPYDPIAQTFRIDRTNPNGVFVTELDLFFREKDMVQGVEAYIVTTDGNVPSSTILPHSRVVKPSDSIIRVKCELHSQVTDTTLLSGTVVRGSKSGATGVIKSDVKFDSFGTNLNKNVNNTIYNIVLDNYLNEFVPGESIIPDVNPVNRSTFTIVEDEITVSRIDLTSMGERYSTNTIITIGEPDLPGGVQATAVVKTSPTNEFGLSGQIYEVVLTDSGSGYTKSPPVTFTGSGTGAEAKCRIVSGRKSVEMGVSVSDDASSPTKFKFHAPVYLLGNTTYAFIVKSPTSKKYSMWTCKLGENKIGTSQRVVQQPNTGMVYTSQNDGVWSEDSSMDITFNLRRAEFVEGLIADLTLTNAPMYTRIIQKDPIETGIVSEGGTQFYSNSSAVRVHHFNHGFVPGDMVMIEGVEGNPGGILNDEINGVHKVMNSDLDDFTIHVDTSSNVRSSKSGGNRVSCTYNRPYESLNLYSGAMAFPSSLLTATNRGTEYAGIDSLLSDDSYGQYNKSNEYKLDAQVDIPIMDTYYYSDTKQVAHYLNEILYKDDLHLNGRKSMETKITLGTNDSKVSPVIDLHRTNMTVIRNMIDNPSSITKADSGIKSTNVDDSFYRNETFNNGSVYSKWISKLFVFENQCDGIEVRLASVFYGVDDIKVYFKPRTIGFDGDFAKVNWIPFNGNQIKPGESRKVMEDGKEIFVRTPGLPNQADIIKPRNTLNVDPRLILADDWQELTWTEQDLAKFDGVAIKIIMSTSNPALSPLIDDFQLIVSE